MIRKSALFQYCLHFPHQSPNHASTGTQSEISALLAYAEDLEIENASTLRKQDMMFAILKQLADNDVAIYGSGVLEVLSDGFGFLRALSQIIYLGRMISTYRQARYAGLDCELVIRLKGNPRAKRR